MTSTRPTREQAAVALEVARAILTAVERRLDDIIVGKR
jgi:hypothetical protein